LSVGKGSINRVNNLNSAQSVSSGIKAEIADSRNLVDISTLVPVPDRWFFYSYSSTCLESLKESLLKFGVLEPLIVRTLNDGTFQLLSGYLRVMACSQIGISKVKCEVLNAISDEAAYEIYMELHQDKTKDSQFSKTKFSAVSMIKNALPDYLL
jgi:hypothetical protein